MRHESAAAEKPLHWVGSSKRDLLEFPGAVVSEIGWALGVAQFGGRHPAAKRWKGEGSGVLEIVENRDGNAYRAVYTVRFQHATAKTDVGLVHARLMAARADYEVRYGKGQK